MNKRLVICSDGTWNQPEHSEHPEEFPTNVLKVARAIAPYGDDGTPQQVFYDWGVGTGDRFDQVVAGITGRGLDKNIVDGYRYLVQNFSPDDEIFLFGFSRGAYTARSLCGLINTCGILEREHASLVEEAFELYRSEGAEYEPDGQKSVAFRKDHSHPNSQKVKFVGVWDTVGSLGIPLAWFNFFNKRYQFHNTNVGSNVEIARHALALDERREHFIPTIWNPTEGVDLKQVWFPGSHSDVGGSYEPDKSKHGDLLMADVPLRWMVSEVRKMTDLKLETHLLSSLCAEALAVDATLHESWKLGFFRYISWIDDDDRAVDHGKGPVLIHESVQQRWEHRSDYRPKGLQRYLQDRGWPTTLIRTAIC